MGQDQSESVDVKLENYLKLFRAWLQAFGVWSSRENFQFCITHSTALLLAPLTSQGTLRGKDWKEVMELSDAFTMRERSSLPIWFLCDWIFSSAEASLLSNVRDGATISESKTEKRSKISLKQKMEELELKSEEGLFEKSFEIPPKENTPLLWLLHLPQGSEHLTGKGDWTGMGRLLWCDDLLINQGYFYF